MAKRGRPRKSGIRDKSGRLLELGRRHEEPCERILQIRALYSWLRPARRSNETDAEWNLRKRDGNVDQDVCDGIGQLGALGILDGHGHDPQDMVRAAREWRDLWLKWMRRSGAKLSSFERADGSSRPDLFYADALTDAERARFEKLDDGLQGYERSILLSLLVDPMIGSRHDGKPDASWVMSHIAYALLERKIVPPLWMQPVRFPGADDHDKLAAAIRGLCILVDGTIPQRWERAA